MTSSTHVTPMDAVRLEGETDWLELCVVQYEFPELTMTPYDSNWLVIRARAGSARGHWTASDPCLLTYELRQLAEWFESVGEDSLDEWLEFLEPTLAFRAASGAIEARLEYGFAPPWAKSADDPVVLSFGRTPAELARAAKALRAQASLFPQRAAR